MNISITNSAQKQNATNYGFNATNPQRMGVTAFSVPSATDAISGLKSSRDKTDGGNVVNKKSTSSKNQYPNADLQQACSERTSNAQVLAQLKLPVGGDLADIPAGISSRKLESKAKHMASTTQNGRRPRSLEAKAAAFDPAQSPASNIKYPHRCSRRRVQERSTKLEIRLGSPLAAGHHGVPTKLGSRDEELREESPTSPGTALLRRMTFGHGGYQPPQTAGYQQPEELDAPGSPFGASVSGRQRQQAHM